MKRQTLFSSVCFVALAACSTGASSSDNAQASVLSDLGATDNGGRGGHGDGHHHALPQEAIDARTRCARAKRG